MSTKFKTTALRAFAAAAAFTLALTSLAPAAYAEGQTIEVGGADDPTLQEALSQAIDGDTVKLLDNVTTDGVLTIAKGITLDINDKKIVSGVTKGSGAISISAGASKSVVIKNGTIEADAVNAIYSNCGADLLLDDLLVESGKYGFYQYGSGDVVVSSSVLTSRGSNAIDLFEGKSLTVRGSTLQAASGSNALSISWKFAGSVNLETGNQIIGTVKLAGNENHTPYYRVNVTGGSFDSGIGMPFVHPNNDEKQILNRLNLVAGYFKVNVGSLVQSGYQCLSAGPSVPAGYSFEVVKFEGKVTPYYSLDETGARIYYDTLASGIAAVKNNDAVLYVTENASIDANGDYSGVTISTISEAKLSYTGTIEQLLESGISFSGANILCSDASVDSIRVAEGRVSAGTVAEGSYESVSKLLSDGLIILGDDIPGKIDSLDECFARIGSLGYRRLNMAIDAASSNDSADQQINDVILLLRDWTLGALRVDNQYACFTLEMGGSSIIMQGNNMPVQIVTSNVDVTIRNGAILGGSCGIASNGMFEGVNLTLDNVNVSANEVDGIAMYLPAGGTTNIKGGVITGGTGIQICGGSLVIDGAEVTATGRPEPKNPGDDGGIQDGAAVSILHRDGYPELGTIEIINGEFASADGICPLQAYGVDGNNQPAEWPEAGETVAVSGGSFSAPIDDQLFADGFGGSMKPNGDGQYVVVSKQQYTVKHLFEELGSGKFVENENLAPAETLVGPIDEDSQAVPKNIVGYTAKPIEQKIVASDGSTVVEIYYLRNSYKVIFESNGGSSVAAQTVKYGEKVTKPADPTRAGFTFDAWYSDKELTKLFDFNKALDPKTDEPAMTLYAKWTEVEKPGPKPEQPIIHKVTFVPVVGEDTTIVVTVEDGEFVEVPGVPAIEGYKFAGWFYDKDYKKPFDAEKTRITEDLTLYGGWYKDDVKNPLPPATPQKPVKPAPKPELPQTGDDSMLPIIALGLGGFAVIAAGVVLSRKNKK